MEFDVGEGRRVVGAFPGPDGAAVTRRETDLPAGRDGPPDHIEGLQEGTDQ